MNRIESYPKLTINIVKWIKDYYFYNNIDTLIVGVSGGIDSAVVSTLCAETGLPTYVITTVSYTHLTLPTMCVV